MPSGYLRSLSREGKGSLPALEKRWEEAKQKASDEGKPNDYSLITTIFKNMVGERLEAKYRLMVDERLSTKCRLATAKKAQ